MAFLLFILLTSRKYQTFSLYTWINQNSHVHSKLCYRFNWPVSFPISIVTEVIWMAYLSIKGYEKLKEPLRRVWVNPYAGKFVPSSKGQRILFYQPSPCACRDDRPSINMPQVATPLYLQPGRQPRWVLAIKGDKCFMLLRPNKPLS